MFNQVFVALNAFFTMLTTIFAAGEKGAKSLDNLAGWAATSTQVFVDEAESDRELALMERAHAREERRKQLAAITSATTPLLP